MAVVYLLNAQLDTNQTTEALHCVSLIHKTLDSDYLECTWRPPLYLDCSPIISSLQAYFFNELNIGLLFTSGESSGFQRYCIQIFDIEFLELENANEEIFEDFKWHCEEVLSRSNRPVISIVRIPTLLKLSDKDRLSIEVLTSQYLREEHQYRLYRTESELYLYQLN